MGHEQSKRKAQKPRSAGELVRAGLERTLHDVRRSLDRAALDAEANSEDVHDLRVAARRGRTLVRIAGDLLRKRDRQRLRRWLRNARRAAGEARELDVLLQQHGDAPAATLDRGERALLAEARERRAAAQGPIDAIHARLETDAARAGRERRILRRVRRRGEDTPVRRWAAARLAHLFDRFVEATPLDFHDAAALHRYRIRAKDLRYALDELERALPRRLVRTLEPTLVELQDRLGAAHDHAVQATRFRRWRESGVDPVLGAHLASLAEREADALSAGVDGLEAWWRPLAEAHFLTAFAAALERAAAR